MRWNCGVVLRRWPYSRRFLRRQDFNLPIAKHHNDRRNAGDEELVRFWADREIGWISRFDEPGRSGRIRC